MRIRFCLPAIAASALLLAASCAAAADLAARGHIGAIFAEPPPRAIARSIDTRNETNAIAAEAFFAVQPRIPGYYGQPGDFDYRSYYGTSPLTIFGRNPYACTLLSQC